VGYSSVDDMVQKLTVSGKFWRSDWNKLTHATTTQNAGEWYCLFHSTGNPAAGTLGAVGTNLAFHPLTDQSTGALTLGGAVSPDTKHILNASGFSAASTTMPAVFMLVDLLGWYPVTTTTTTGNQALINSKTFTAANATDLLTFSGWDIQSFMCCQVSNSGGGLPAGLSAATNYFTIRQSATTIKLASSMANAIAGTAIDITSDGTGTQTLTMVLDRSSSGAGVQAFSTPSVVLGAGTPTIQLTYTNSSAIGSRVTPTTLPVSKASAPIGIIEYSGTGAGKYGPFIPLQGGDAGIQTVDQFNYSVTHTSGTTNVLLCRPLFYLPMTTIGVAAERDLLNQLPSLPRVYDYSCLAWLMYAGASTPTSSAFFGSVDLGWA
jgi:hypothetical protein